MKIECDKCAAKYSIADEKVRGKTFKIRCKKCSNVIIVRDKAAAAPAVDAHEDEADEGALGWHLAINGETVGPLAEEDVRDRYSAGEIDKDTAIWQEGFEDWIPLGDVPVFGDLPDAPAGGGGYDDGEDDPFASANQEDYAAGGAGAAVAGAAVAGAAAAAAHQPAAAAQSPRVSSLTGQRNENSVLFSLDSLQQLATGGNASAPVVAKPSAGANQQVGTKGLATAAPGSEGSGLIDIRALGAMVGNEQPVASATPATADDAALPSFGGSGLGGLAAAPLVATPSPEPAAAVAAAAPPPPARSNAPIYILMVLLILALGGLAAYILLKPDDEPTVIVKEVPTAAPSVGDKDDDDKEDKKSKDDDDDDDDDKEKEKDEDEKDEDGKGEGDEDAAASTDKPSSNGGKKGGRRSSGNKKKKPSSDPLAGIGDPKPSSKKPTKSGGGGGGSSDVSVDCILDPSSCKKGGSKKPSGGSKKPTGGTDPNLPEKLSSTDIKAGIAPVKGAAKACGGKHGASPGTKVQVRLSIQGSTGTVSTASAQPPHNGTPLGNCVAAALKKAKFKKFKKASLGAVYPVRM